MTRLREIDGTLLTFVLRIIIGCETGGQEQET